MRRRWAGLVFAAGRLFRAAVDRYVEGIDSERGIAWHQLIRWRCSDFWASIYEHTPPDHSTISRTRRLIDLETRRDVFTWVLERTRRGRVGQRPDNRH